MDVNEEERGGPSARWGGNVQMLCWDHGCECCASQVASKFFQVVRVAEP